MCWSSRWPTLGGLVLRAFETLPLPRSSFCRHPIRVARSGHTAVPSSPIPLGDEEISRLRSRRSTSIGWPDRAAVGAPSTSHAPAPTPIGPRSSSGRSLEDDLLSLYRDLLRTRLHDIGLKRWVRTGVISKAWLGTGEEATTVGTVRALDPGHRDIVSPMIRNAGSLHMMGMPLSDMVPGVPRDVRFAQRRTARPPHRRHVGQGHHPADQPHGDERHHRDRRRAGVPEPGGATRRADVGR